MTGKLRYKDIDLGLFSRFRAAHMGFAMLIIILFHVALPRSDAFYGLRRMGNIGVDIFLFLSGIGLWFAWTKDKAGEAEGFFRRWADFYKRRLLRVYPTWLIIACLYYIPRYKHGLSLWADGHGLLDLAGDILINWDFWLHDELTFWYIPAIMLLYVFAPPFMELIVRHPLYRWAVVAMIVWPFLVQWVEPIHSYVGHIEIFWSRVPIFFLGISMGEMIKRKESVDGALWWLAGIIFLMTFVFSFYMEQYLHGRFPLFLERLVYIPLVVTSLMLLNSLWALLPKAVYAVFAWIGGVSLETYLIHSHFVLWRIERMHLGYWPTFILCTTISLALAWMLQKAVSLVMSKLTKN